MTTATNETLADLCDFVSTQVAPQDFAQSSYLGLEHLTSARLLPVAEGKASDVQSSKFRYEKGDVLYGKLRPYLDKAVMAESAGVCTTELLVLRPKPGVSGRFLACLVHAPAFVRHAMAGVTGAHHPRTSWSHIREFEVERFSQNEQEKVADIVWATHSQLLQCERAVAALDRVKAAAMRELFTRGLRGKAQKETDVGPLPDHWNRESLENVATITYGAQAAVANATDPSIGTLILTNINISSDGVINLDKKRYYKVPAQHRERLVLKKGDVLFNWRSGSASHVGKTALFDLDGEFTYSSFILRFRPYRLVSSQFLFRLLSHMRSEGFFLIQRNVSSINSVFNASLAATIPIWFPPPEEQQEIVEILDAIDQKIEIHKKKRSVLDALFKSLIHKLMTGEIRVSDLDLSALDDSKLTEVPA